MSPTHSIKHNAGLDSAAYPAAKQGLMKIVGGYR